MTLEGRDAEYLSYKQNRKPNASKNINEYPVPQKKPQLSQFFPKVLMA